MAAIDYRRARFEIITVHHLHQMQLQMQMQMHLQMQFQFTADDNINCCTKIQLVRHLLPFAPRTPLTHLWRLVPPSFESTKSSSNPGGGFHRIHPFHQWHPSRRRRIEKQQWHQNRI
ncbi:GD21397 [Drosophila simulans]|uniref:GD21397 n=1 Tax=Drosophila simulans TaxID=7240 RepID=B4QZE3_DROSI|nr:GD21397 [Drosophila simulans]